MMRGTMLVLAALVLAVGCEGPMGPKGDAGPAGTVATAIFDRSGTLDATGQGQELLFDTRNRALPPIVNAWMTSTNGIYWYNLNDSNYGTVTIGRGQSGDWAVLIYAGTSAKNLEYRLLAYWVN